MCTTEFCITCSICSLYMTFLFSFAMLYNVLFLMHSNVMYMFLHACTNFQVTIHTHSVESWTINTQVMSHLGGFFCPQVMGVLQGTMNLMAPSPGGGCGTGGIPPAYPP